MSKHRVAVLGGGMAALTAALRLSDTPTLRDRYQIDVYQMGWRLGGKGASGRDVAGGTWRNEEHGLHYLFGFYENAFQVLRALYRELPSDWPWDIDDALKPGRGPILMYENGPYGVEPWPMLWGGEANGRRDNGVPGDGVEIPLTPLAAAKAALWQAAPNLADALSVQANSGPAQGGHRAEDGSFDVVRFCREAHPDDETDHGRLKRKFAAAHAHVENGSINAAIEELESALAVARTLRISAAEGSMERRRKMMLATFFKVTALGVLKDLGSGTRNWFDLDEEDFRAWLRRHGADTELTAAPFVEAIYHSSFATTFAAGTVLHAVFNCIVRCKGHLFYKMQAGMGDVIFAPFYQVLKNRGVKFHFFHRVENLGLTKKRKHIRSIDIDVQAAVKDGYEPLVRNPLNNLPCWPNEPDLSQLEDAERIEREKVNFENWWDTYHVEKKQLKKDRDFDSVILGIGIGAFEDICGELRAHDGRFYEMVEQVVTTETQAAQFWLNRSFQALATDLGDYRAAGSAAEPRPVGLPFAAPWLSWSDMSQLDAQERVSGATAQLYVCGAFPYTDQPPPRRPEFKEYPYLRSRAVRDGMRAYLSEQGGAIWPRAVVNRKFDERILVSFDQSDRYDAQYFVACMNPSDNYVLAVPSSNKYRMRAHETLYANLYLAGDWTLNPMSFGCLESATMGGIGAAHALEPGLVGRATYDWLPAETPRKDPVKGYIFRDGELISDPPVVCDVKLDFFLLPAGHDELTQLCNRCLNIGGPTYRPLALDRPFVVFYCASLLTTTGAGSYEERDFGIWIPVARYDKGVAVEFGTYSPYVWVSNSPALVGGRTVYGYPKQLGTLCLGSDPGAGGVFSVDGLAIPVQGGTMEESRILDAARIGEPEREAGFESEQELVDLLAMMLNVEHHLDWRQVWQLYEDHGMQQILLKQFLGANGRSEAVYQAIIEAQMKINSGFQGGIRPGHYELGVLDSFSHRIVENLGLKWSSYRQTERNGFFQVPVLSQGWMQFNATLGTGQVVHRNI